MYQAINNLLTQNLGFFNAMGQNLFRMVATILIAWYGIKSAHLEPVPGVSLRERALLGAVKNIARRLGDDISEAKPILDSCLPDGSRVAAIIPPCSLRGVTLTIRKFNSRRIAIDELVEAGILDRALANKLEDYVLNRKNILISGGTGSGKTTLLNAAARFIPPDARLLLIEDTAEIQIAHSNLVRLEARVAQPGIPAIAIHDLLKATLRHRPDRILLGEIRGQEAFDLLQLLNTGHAGTHSTIHASSAIQALSRFASCVLQSGVELPFRAIKRNITDSLDVVVHVERRPGRRLISEVIEIKSYEPDTDRFDHCCMYEEPETRMTQPTPQLRKDVSPKDYIQWLFQATERVAILTRNRDRGETAQRIASVATIARTLTS